MQKSDFINVTLVGGPGDGEVISTPSSNTRIRYANSHDDKIHDYFRFENELKFYWGEDDD